MWLSILIIHYLGFNDYFDAHKKVNGSWSGGFLPDVYQIWDEAIWLTSEKECLLSNVPICWEHMRSSEVSQQLYYNYWNSWDFCLKKCATSHAYLLFSNPSSVPFLPGQELMGLDPSSPTGLLKNGDLLAMWLLPMGMASTDWIGGWTLGLPFAHGFIFSELPGRLLICHTLKLTGQGLYFTGKIIWLQYSFPLWELQMLSTTNWCSE